MAKPRLAMLTTLALGLLAHGCAKKKDNANNPATTTSAAGQAARGLPALQPGAGGERMGVHEGAPPAVDPHAGLGMNGNAADPHAGLGAADPHAGAGGADPANPHAGMGMGGGAAGAPANPNAVIEGTISVAPKLADQVKKGAVVFLSARSMKTKGIVAVERLVIDELPVKFRLDTSSSMMGGGQALAEKDKVLLTIVVDKDGDPMKKQGEVEALAEVEVPARGLKLSFDHIREAP